MGLLVSIREYQSTATHRHALMTGPEKAVDQNAHWAVTSTSKAAGLADGLGLRDGENLVTSQTPLKKNGRLTELFNPFSLAGQQKCGPKRRV
jgi:hypothetical protein